MSGEKDWKDLADEEWTEEYFKELVQELNAPSSPYVVFDEREDVLASLELLTVIAPLVYQRSQLWKWMIVGAQNALQGAMVCALRDTTGTSVLDKKSAAKMLNWLQGDTSGEMPNGRLDDFLGLLRKCEEQLRLVLGEKQREALTRLHGDFRNPLIHFTPKGWSIEKAGLPRIIGAAIDAIETLMAMDTVGVRLEEWQSARLRSEITQIRAALGELGKRSYVALRSK